MKKIFDTIRLKRTFTNVNRGIAIALSFLILITTSVVEGQQDDNELYLAIELNGVVCGYSKITVSDSLMNGKKYQIMNQSTFANFFALGKDISSYQKFTYHIDPGNGNFIYHDSYHKQGDVIMGGAVYVWDDTIRITTPKGEEEVITNLPENLILPNTQFYQYILIDFVDLKKDTMTYQTYDVRTGKIQETSYSRTGSEDLNLSGTSYKAIILSQPDPTTGMDVQYWIDINTGMRLKVVFPNRLSIYLADASIKRKIKTGNFDDFFFTKTNQSIKNIRGISQMKVKASLETIPKVTEVDLTIPGQKFIGQISEQKIEGKFEITHQKYEGKNAPSYPLDTNQFDHLTQYIEPGDLIESGDSVIINLAKNITTGSEDLWEATNRLSSWVANNIDGSMHGGSARETLDTKSGLCGSQSMLMAALCRAAGIPARVVWGCMYTREYGGSFGHHAWNEVFMGKAGWIPLDVTIHETDYVDSGHIRLGILNTRQTQINNWEMEILGYKVEDSE